MADAAFYDGQSARRRTVSLEVTASGLDLHEGGERIASWPVGAVRRRDAPEGILRLTLDGGTPLARLEIMDAGDQAAIQALCHHLEAAEHKERPWRIVFWSALAALSVALCVLFLVPVVAERLTPLIPASLEKRLGRAVDNQVRLALGSEACAHPEGVSALKSLTGRLLEAAGSTADADVVVLDAEIPNAMALPGGRIYLFKALLDRAETPDEVGGVLAHEIGHVVQRDRPRKLIQVSGASYLLDLLFGDVTGAGAIIAGAQILLDTAYSREVETQADGFAARTMLALGRRPAAMGVLLKRIEGNESQAPAFLQNHPVTDQRLKALEKQVPSQSGGPLLTDEEWRALKEICKTT